MNENTWVDLRWMDMDVIKKPKEIRNVKVTKYKTCITWWAQRWFLFMRVINTKEKT
jgi:hypothetical protein